MARNAEKPFETLAVRCDVERIRTAVFSVADDVGEWIDPYDDTIVWNEFLVYGVPDTQDALDKVLDEDFGLAIKIGKIFGCHIPKSLIVDLGADPYQVCDAAHADLESMYSVLQEYEDFEVWNDNIYYISEIELNPEYQGLGYETMLLLQLPAIIVKTLHVFPSLLMYFPALIRRDKPVRDSEAEAILLHRLEYNAQCKRNDNIFLFPPKREIPEKEINRFLGRRSPGDIVREEYQNQDLLNIYKSVGFKKIGQTGWLCKQIGSIYTGDGYNN